MTEPIAGLLAAPHTPMHADAGVNLDRIAAQAELLSANGLAGAFICGTTGEGMSLTVDERMAVARRWVDLADEDLRVIVHVGASSGGDARALARQAGEIGAWGIAAMGPSFFRPQAVEDLVSHCAEIAAEAPALPFYYYHIPVLTRVTLPMRRFLELGAERIATLAGIKYTDEDLMDFAMCMDVCDGRFDILFGRDEILLAGLALGAVGAVGSTYNYAAPLYHRIIEAFRSGDMPTARALQKKAMHVVDAMRMFPNRALAASKAGMKLAGVDCGPVRGPNQNFTDEQFDAYARRMHAIGFDEFRCRL